MTPTISLLLTLSILLTITTNVALTFPQPHWNELVGNQAYTRNQNRMHIPQSLSTHRSPTGRIWCARWVSATGSDWSAHCCETSFSRASSRARRHVSASGESCSSCSMGSRCNTSTNTPLLQRNCSCSHACQPFRQHTSLRQGLPALHLSHHHRLSVQR